MDRSTFSTWGSLVCVVVVIAIMMAFATPFSKFVTQGVQSVMSDFKATADEALNVSDIGGNGGDNGGVETPLEPGLYDTSNNLVCSWEALTAEGQITVSNTVITAANIDAVGWLRIQDGITSIDTFAFGSNDNLTGVYIPDSVTNIESQAFNGCSNLASVRLPENITAINDLTFSQCESLTSVTIPDKVTSIGESAFFECTSLTNITLPNELKWIFDKAFYGCTGLTSITLPETVSEIYYCAFNECSGLENINFNGTVEQWNAIYLDDSGWKYGAPATYVQCSNGQVPLN